MRKILAVALIGVAAVAIAMPATARPDRRYGEHSDHRGYQDYGVVTDRNGDGYDDRDRNFNHWIDPWEQSGGSRYSHNDRSWSATDRNGDGYDDRDQNFDGWIDRWEQRSVSPRYANNRRNQSNGSATDRNGDGYDDRDANRNGYIESWEIDGGDRRW